MSFNHEWEKWLDSIEFDEFAVQPKSSQVNQKWICGRCGWTTNENDRAMLHMWACGQFSLFKN